MDVFPGRLAESGFRRGGRVGALFGAAGLLDGPAQDELDLPVEAAQIVVGPALEGFQQGDVDTKQERFTLGHRVYRFPSGYRRVPDEPGHSRRVS